AIRTIAAGERSRIYPRSVLMLEHDACIARVAIAADASAVAIQAAVLIGHRPAHKPVRLILPLPAELKHGAVERESGRTIAPIMIGVAAAYLPPQAVVLAAQGACPFHDWARHHGAHEVDH